MTLVSIIITCFNSQETIERTIKSALNQDWDKKEIIIVDDFSTDSSFEILSRICLRNKEITLLRNKYNMGYPASLNRGIKQSKGEFIAIFDDDDDNLKNRISLQVKKIIACEEKYNQPLILCYSNREIFKQGSIKCDDIALAIGRKPPEPYGEEVAEFLFGLPVNPLKTWGMFGSCTLMTRKNTFDKVGLFDESFRRTAEWDFAVRSGFQGAYFVAVNKSLIKMYKTSGSEKSGKIPLLYSLKLREKYKNYLINKSFYNASKFIARSNFYFNKKKIMIGSFFRLVALLLSPKLMFNYLQKKLFKIVRVHK